jgi:putative transposase
MAASNRVEATFFTATILEWKQLLKQDKYKDIIVDSLAYLVNSKRVVVYGFVIMNNHLHLIWGLHEGQSQEKVQQSFLKYTAQQIKADLIVHHPKVLAHFKVDAADRKYQFWERNPLSVFLWNEAVLLQKLHYIHENPVRAGVVSCAADYHYSSASYYDKGTTRFPFLTRYDRYA